MPTRNINISLAMTRDRILIKRLPRTLGKTGKLAAPDRMLEERIPLGRVIQLGPGLERPDGTVNPIGVYVPGDDPAMLVKRPLQPGDTVFYLHAGSTEMDLAGEKFYVVHEPSIVGLAHVDESRIVTP